MTGADSGATQQPYHIMYVCVCEMGLAARRALISTQNNSKSTATRRVGRNYPPRAEDNLSGNLHTTPTGCHAGAKCVCLMIMPERKRKSFERKNFCWREKIWIPQRSFCGARAEKINRREIVEYITEWPLM